MTWWPEVAYKPGHTVELFERDGDLVCLITATVQDVHDPKVSITTNFRSVTSVRGMDDKRVLEHWVAGMIAQYEQHESSHWLKFDWELMRDE
jgi:hypothetical protein